MKSYFRQFMIISLGLAFLMTMIGCAPRLDTSSDEALNKSIEEISDSLDKEKQEEFRVAFLRLHFLVENDELYSHINGYTADEVIDFYKETSKKKDIERLEKKIADAPADLEHDIQFTQKKIDEYTADIEKAKAAKIEEAAKVDLMKQFVVSESKIKIVQEYFMKYTNIKFKVYNGSSFAIKDILLNGKLHSPGRSIPWHEGGLNISISGGLEPGESKTISGQANMMSGWARIDKIPEGAVFDLDVVGVVRADDSEVELSDTDFDKQIADLNEKISTAQNSIKEKQEKNAKTVAEWQEQLKKLKES